jgi:hypothetical protein
MTETEMVINVMADIRMITESTGTRMMIDNTKLEKAAKSANTAKTTTNMESTESITEVIANTGAEIESIPKRAFLGMLSNMTEVPKELVRLFSVGHLNYLLLVPPTEAIMRLTLARSPMEDKFVKCTLRC